MGNPNNKVATQNLKSGGELLEYIRGRTKYINIKEEWRTLEKMSLSCSELVSAGPDDYDDDKL